MHFKSNLCLIRSEMSLSCARSRLMIPACVFPTAGDPDQLWRFWPGDRLWYSDNRRRRGGGRPYDHPAGVSIRDMLWYHFRLQLPPPSRGKASLPAASSLWPSRLFTPTGGTGGIKIIYNAHLYDINTVLVLWTTTMWVDTQNHTLYTQTHRVYRIKKKKRDV